MPEWTAQTPLRVVTGYQAIAKRFFEEKGFKHFVLLAADGALEAHPAMGSADIILDLVRRTLQHAYVNLVRRTLPRAPPTSSWTW